MKIRNVTIKNFRGVKELDWSLSTANIFCLIGKGDSSKSTILEAIRNVFYPQWNLVLSDSDFYQCKVENAIVIEVTIGDLVEELCSLNKYGYSLRGWDAGTNWTRRGSRCFVTSTAQCGPNHLSCRPTLKSNLACA